jgi:hypothetical protein
VDCPYRRFSENALTIFGGTKVTGGTCVKISFTVHPFCVFTFLIFAGCASTSNRVMSGYKRMKFEDSTLGVVLIRKNIQVLNAEDVARDLGRGVSEDAYYVFFADAFPAAMKARSKFAKIYFVRHGDEMLGNSGNQVDYGARTALPSRKGCVSDSLQYLLIVDYLTVAHERKTNMPVGGGSDGSFAGFFSGSESLTHAAEFVLWDNKAGTIAAYGSIRERISIYDPLTREVWDDMVQKMARSVTRGMPYRK